MAEARRPGREHSASAQRSGSQPVEERPVERGLPVGVVLDSFRCRCIRWLDPPLDRQRGSSCRGERQCSTAPVPVAAASCCGWAASKERADSRSRAESCRSLDRPSDNHRPTHCLVIRTTGSECCSCIALRVGAAGTSPVANSRDRASSCRSTARRSNRDRFGSSRSGILRWGSFPNHRKQPCVDDRGTRRAEPSTAACCL